ncbi:MAG: hypothetical protein AAFO07_23790, partial [Bacteroidota bacterium]
MKYLIFCALFWFSLNLLQSQTQLVDYTIFYNFTYVTDTTQNTFSEAEEYLLFKYKNESRFVNTYAYHNDSLHASMYSSLRNKAGTQEGLNTYLKAYGSKKKKHITDLRLLKDFKRQTAIITLFGSEESKYM